MLEQGVNVKLCDTEDVKRAVEMLEQVKNGVENHEEHAYLDMHRIIQFESGFPNSPMLKEEKWVRMEAKAEMKAKAEMETR